jgi:hypothetical protein
MHRAGTFVPKVREHELRPDQRESYADCAKPNPPRVVGADGFIDRLFRTMRQKITESVKLLAWALVRSVEDTE